MNLAVAREPSPVNPGDRAPLIDLSDVRKTFVTGGGYAVEVLHGVSLSIHQGEFVAIMGASGSGKSTLMNILGCLDTPSAGSYRFGGRDTADLGRDELAELRRDAFGFVFQSYNLIATATALENVEIPGIYAGMRPGERHARAAMLLGGLGLEERLDHRPSQLSGGQQQRVSIARALMNGGRIILADEPTGALDSRSGADVMALLRQLADAGHTVILVTHDHNVAAHADRLIEIADGLISADSGSRHLKALPPAEEFALPDGGRIGFIGDAYEAVKMALRALRRNLFRTILTLLGIVIGVGSVVAMLAVGEGATKDVMARINAMGSNQLVIRPGMPNQRGPSAAGITSLVAEDAVAIEGLGHVRAAVPEKSSSLTLRFGNSDYMTQVTGTTQGLPLIRDWAVAEGAFFSDADSKGLAAVAVLGQTVVKNLFPVGIDPVGKVVLISNVPFEVIGVMAPKGAASFGQDMDDNVFVPLSTAALRLFGESDLRSITVSVADESLMTDVQQKIANLLIERHRIEDFQIRNMAAIIEAASQTAGTMTILLGSIAAISLVVGGIGVMNIMLVSVTERTREIGIRMATGARTRNILQQFLVEAIIVSALGGLIGVGLGIVSALVIGALGMSIQFSIPTILLAFTCAAAVGLVFGLAPAIKAARMNPVTALASE
ncbi:MacB family efflux pump subunit [Dongia sp.]|jgi:macrolide transport system ATP-binding/permease protein|uniref:MacB family efflux pump subunit n=1 Tax=Dongia sp. TaxID=1977262 RepID=UPI0035AF9C00